MKLLILVTAFAVAFSGPMDLPGYIFLPGIDTNFIDGGVNPTVLYLAGRQPEQLKDICDRLPKCNHFSLDGTVRSNEQPLKNWVVDRNRGMFIKTAQTGYTFYPGLDLISNDNTAAANDKTANQLFETCNNNAACVGFNHLGNIRQNAGGAVIKPTDTSNNGGIFVKNSYFSGYNYFSTFDIDNGATNQRSRDPNRNTASQLIESCKAGTCTAFCTDGTVKNVALNRDITTWNNKFNGGCFVRDITNVSPNFSNFIFYKGFDSQSGDLNRTQGRSIEDLINMCNNDPKCVSFNTDGYMRTNVLLPASLWNRWDGGFFAKRVAK